MSYIFQVTCYFPDHGDTDWQIPDQLRPLDPEINKLLPYQAIEVSLYGLEDVATNVTALSKLCDLALANTCVAEVVERFVGIEYKNLSGLWIGPKSETQCFDSWLTSHSLIIRT